MTEAQALMEIIRLRELGQARDREMAELRRQMDAHLKQLATNSTTSQPAPSAQPANGAVTFDDIHSVSAETRARVGQQLADLIRGMA